jgi:hypothetical protein
VPELTSPEVACHEPHEGPCETVLVKFHSGEDRVGTYGRVTISDQGASVTLTWRDDPASRYRVGELVQAVPHVLSNMAQEAQMLTHADEGIDDLEEWLRGRSE